MTADGEVPQMPGLRVLIVTPTFFPHVGGVEIHVDELTSRLTRAGVSFDVVTSNHTGTLPEQEVRNGVRITRLPTFPGPQEARLMRGLGRAIGTGSWDLVHVQHFHSIVAPTALRATQQLGIPTVLTFHGGGNRAWARARMWPPRLSMVAPFAIEVHRRTLRRTTALIAVAQFEIDDLAPRIGVGRDRFSLIRNGSDLPAVSGRVRTPDPHAPRIVSMGRLAPGKGHEHVLDAFAWIVADRPDAHLWIAGSGPMESELASRAARLGVEHRVEISAVPSGERERLAARLMDCDVLVSMSRYETHPVSVMEAIALGLKTVVADDRAGLRELAGLGLSTLIPGGSSPAQASRVILAAIDSPDLTHQPTVPTWDECADATLATYRRAVADGAGEHRGARHRPPAR